MKPNLHNFSLIFYFLIIFSKLSTTNSIKTNFIVGNKIKDAKTFLMDKNEITIIPSNLTLIETPKYYFEPVMVMVNNKGILYY